MKLSDLASLPSNLSSYKVHLYETYTNLMGQQCNIFIGSPSVQSNRGKQILIQPCVSKCTLGSLLQGIGRKSLSTPIYIESSTHSVLNHAYLSISNTSKQISILASY